MPNLRFPEFTGEWERTTLGKIGATYNGLTGKNATDFGSGSPFITYKSIFDDSKIDVSRVEYVRITDTEKEKQTQNKVEYGDIFFTTSSETPEEVGMASVLLSEISDCYLNSFCFGYRLFNKTIHLPEFFRFYLRSKSIRRKIAVLAQGSTRFNISKNEVMKTLIFIPSFSEQRKISELFSLIEERIETQKKIIEDLKKLKSEISNILLKSRKWEEYIIGDLCDSVPAKPYICSSVITDGVYPVIQQGENPIIGYTNSIPFKDYMKVIIFGDHTLSVYRPNAPFLISTDGLKILTPKSSINRDFLYYLVCAFKPQPEGYKRHYSILKEISVPVPPLDKQRQIAMILLSVDSKINIEAKMLEKQLLQKYYLLNQMFI